VRSAGRWAAVAAMTIGLVGPAGAEAAPGDLDASFGTGGKVTTDLGGSEDVQAGALQADGRVVVVGGRTDGPTGDFTDFLVARYTPSGALDTSFSSDGWATTDFLGGRDHPTEVVIQPDGKIVVAGSVSPPFEGEGEGGVGLARYNADGSLDTGFSGDGKAIVVDISGGLGMGLVLQPDGRLVIAGYVPEGFTTKLALARLDPDGSLDTSFSGDGIEVSDVGDFYTPVALKRADDGKLVVLAFDENLADYSVLRYTPAGALDPTFDSDGVRLDPALIARDLVTLPGGKILLAGSAFDHSTFPGSHTMHFTRLNADGSLDPTFSGDGRHETAMSDHVVAHSLALQPDGKMLVGGSYGEGTHLANWPMLDAAVFRFNPTGTLDPTFSGNGEAVVDMGGLLDGFASVLLLPGDGRIVGVGPSFTENGADIDIAVARLHGGGPPPDTTPPDTTITSGPGATTTGPAATFQFVSSEASSSFACRVDGAAFAPCGSPHTTATLAAGAHTFDVRATDPAGNTDPTPATYSFSVAASAPTSPPPAPSPASPAGSPTSPTSPQVSRACTTARSVKARATRRLAKAQKQLRRATRPAAKRRLRKVVKKRKAALQKAKRSTRRACG
jgi:uncharacterized delta-60 repeat protein